MSDGAQAGLTTRLTDWMHQRSWAIAMTVAIVITCGGLVILETARQRIASEYETALEARNASVQLSDLAGQLAQLQSHESRFLLTRDDADARSYCARAADIRRGIRSLDTYFKRAADSAELSSFTQIAALIGARIGSGAHALQQAASHPLDLIACGGAAANSSVDASLVTSTG